MRMLLASTSSGSRGGGELALLYLGRALRERGHDVTLWTANDTRMDELAAAFAHIGTVLRSDYLNTYSRRGRSIASWLDGKTARRIATEWRAHRPDVIHLNKQNLEDGLDLVAAARLSGLPALCMIHITQSARYLRAAFATSRDFVARRALRRFPGLLITTPGSRARDLADFLGDGSRVRTVANGVAIPGADELSGRRDEKRRELGVSGDQLLCVAVGRMVPQKRPMLYLEMAERISNKLSGARFLWVGDGGLSNQWDEWVSAHGLSRVIRRLPWQDDVPALLAAADVFFHVAEFEGLAFAILEALAAGLPCAITPNLLAEMPFLDGTNSIALGEDGAWMELLRNREVLREIGGKARRLAEEQFSFRRMGADYEKLYLEAIRGTP